MIIWLPQIQFDNSEVFEELISLQEPTHTNHLFVNWITIVFLFCCLASKKKICRKKDMSWCKWSDWSWIKVFFSSFLFQNIIYTMIYFKFGVLSLHPSVISLKPPAHKLFVCKMNNWCVFFFVTFFTHNLKPTLHSSQFIVKPCCSSVSESGVNSLTTLTDSSIQSDRPFHYKNLLIQICEYKETKVWFSYVFCLLSQTLKG